MLVRFGEVYEQANRSSIGELDGVAQQVEQDLPQAGGVGLDRFRQQAGEVDLQRQGLVLGATPHQLHDPAHDLDRRYLPPVHPQLAGFDLREVEDVVDDVQQVVAVGHDGAYGFLGVGGRHCLRKHLCETEDGGHRRADFVAHVGQKRTLCLRGLLRTLARAFQLGGLGFHLRGVVTQLGLVELGLGDVLDGPGHAHRLVVLVTHRNAARPEPAVGAGLGSQAVFDDVGLVLLQVQTQALHGVGTVLGMEMCFPGREAAVELVVLVAEQLLEPGRQPHLVGHQVPVPDAVGGALHRQGEAFLRGATFLDLGLQGGVGPVELPVQPVDVAEEPGHDDGVAEDLQDVGHVEHGVEELVGPRHEQRLCEQTQDQRQDQRALEVIFAPGTLAQVADQGGQEEHRREEGVRTAEKQFGKVRRRQRCERQETEAGQGDARHRQVNRGRVDPALGAQLLFLSPG